VHRDAGEFDLTFRKGFCDRRMDVLSKHPMTTESRQTRRMNIDRTRAVIATHWLEPSGKRYIIVRNFLKTCRYSSPVHVPDEKKWNGTPCFSAT